MKTLRNIKDYIMTGISYALPVIIAGSMLIAIARTVGLLAGAPVLGDYEETVGFLNFMYRFDQVGWTGIGLLNVVLGGFTAYGMVGKPGLASGFIAGALASSNDTGFIGAVIGALFAGWLTKQVLKLKVPDSIATIMPILVIPLVTVAGTAIFILLVIEAPFSWLNNQLTMWVTNTLESGRGVTPVFGLLGGMMGADLGGPINKAAWAPAQALVFEGIYTPKVLINIGAAVPPLGYGIAVLLQRNKFSKELQQAGLPSLLMGIIGITEGAIPFTLKSPKMIIFNILGSGVGTAVAAFLGVGASAPPVSGAYGFFSVTNPINYLIGVFVGASIVTGGALLFGNFEEKEVEESSEEDIDISLEFN